MHTTCPECSSVFRVTAEQLNIAHGQVRCGYCQAVFDALGSLEDDWKENLPGHDQTSEDSGHLLNIDDDGADTASALADANQNDTHSADQQHGEDSLLDELLTDKDDGAPRPRGPIATEDEPSVLAELEAGKRGNIPSADTDYHPLEAVDIKQQAQALFGKLQAQIQHGGNTQDPTPECTNIEHSQEVMQDDTEMEGIIAADSDIADYVLDNAEDSANAGEDSSTDAPHILREELAAIAEHSEDRFPFLWPAGIALLIALLALQGLYYFRNDLAKHDNYRGLVVSMCNILSCEVPLRNDAQQGIKTLLMRSHAISAVPGQANRLQITAVFTNTANYRQAYPLIKVNMTDETGKVTAMRRFLPQEYLAPHIDISEGLPAQTSIEVIIDIIKPRTPVISYQLDFL